MTESYRKPHALRRLEPLPPQNKIAWSLTEGAAVTGLCVRTLQGAIRRGELQSIRVGRRVLLAPGTVSDWLNARQDAPRVPALIGRKKLSTTSSSKGHR